MRLSPELLFALKLLLITSVSSVGEMWYCGASVSGVNVSIGMDSSQNISLLKSANVCSGRSVLSFPLFFSSPQNCLGRCLSISGRVNWNCALLFLHYFPNCSSASQACLCILPFYFTAFLYLVRAVLHLSLNHGARCFAHLFGFFATRLLLTSRTPAIVASLSRNASIFADRSALSSSYVLVMALNATTNSTVDVCCFHLFALALYSVRYSPYIHRYVFDSSSVLFCISGGVPCSSFSLGWPTLSYASGPVGMFPDLFSWLMGWSCVRDEQWV